MKAARWRQSSAFLVGESGRFHMFLLVPTWHVWKSESSQSKKAEIFWIGHDEKDERETGETKKIRRFELNVGRVCSTNFTSNQQKENWNIWLRKHLEIKKSQRKNPLAKKRVTSAKWQISINLQEEIILSSITQTNLNPQQRCYIVEPDGAWFGTNACSTPYVLIVCNACNVTITSC